MDSSAVEVGEPTDEEDSEDEVRFALTSEAGLNDGLAFPFVYAAIAMAAAAVTHESWFGHWALVDVLFKGVVGVAGGLIVGKLLGKLFFRAPSDKLRLAHHAEGFLALAATFGGGRYQGNKSNLLAAVEPGLFVRLLTRKAGAVELGAAWYQPVWVPENGIRGGAMATIAWHPMFED